MYCGVEEGPTPHQIQRGHPAKDNTPPVFKVEQPDALNKAMRARAKSRNRCDEGSDDELPNNSDSQANASLIGVNPLFLSRWVPQGISTADRCLRNYHRRSNSTNDECYELEEGLNQRQRYDHDDSTETDASDATTHAVRGLTRVLGEIRS
jgi:hypothetical protein